MKKYTQSDFDSFEVDKNGYKICPSGDYTQTGIDIDRIISMKHEYNKSRPYRHGGKKC